MLRDFEVMSAAHLKDDFLSVGAFNPWVEPDFERCIWNGNRMVTEAEYDAELLAEAV